MSSSVGSLGEHALIARVRARTGVAADWVTVGIGDDAAVIEPVRGALTVVTTDSLVEDVHFRRRWTSLDCVGHKALATSASDLAAMGASPRAALLSLALPPDLPIDDFDRLLEGFVSLGERLGLPLIGGNITRSPGPLVLDTTAIGAVGRRSILRRAGARAGDELFVTGSCGAAAAGLALLAASVERTALRTEEAACLVAYERPEPRLRCGGIVGRCRAARAGMDLSDGLADGALQIAAASGTGVVLQAAAVPVHPGAVAAGIRLGHDPSDWALSGGEDYELLFAVSPRQKRTFFGAIHRCPQMPVTRVGHLTKEPGAWLESSGGRIPLGSGYQHFSARQDRSGRP